MSRLGDVFRFAAMAAGAWFGGWVALAASAALAVDANKQKIKQKRRAAADYNSALKDRLEMVDLQPQAPRTLVLGRVRYVEGVRRKWTSGANEQRLTMIVSLAGHEIDAVETVYFDDVALTLDGSGYVTTAPYYKGRTTLGQAIFTVTGGVGSVNVAPNVPIGTTALAIKDVEAPADTVACTIAGTVISCTGAPSDGSYFVNYDHNTGASLARVRAYLGGAGQNVGAALAAEYPGKITSADKFDGIALLVVDIDYDTDVFPQGRPNVTAVMRGAKCYNPATALTVWTENPALHALKYATWASGWNLQSGDYSTADITAAATVCDVSTSFPLSTGSVTLPRYRCGITITADADPAEAMDSIMETMAGRHGWAGGVWRLRAGTLKSTATTMDQTWLVNDNVGGRPNTEPVISAVQAVPRAQQINRVTGACVDPDQRYQVLPFPAVEDAVLVAAHGTRALDVEYPGVNSIAHAQHLASMTIRQAQAGLRLELVCDVRAGVLELFDVVALTMPRYGFSSKLFEVTAWTWTQTGAYRLALAEITAAMFTVEAALTGRDPAPDSDLPAPWDVETITGLAVTSGTAALTDGSVLTRTLVSWDAATKQSIIQGGTIEIQYALVGATTADAWPSWVEQGASTSTTIPGLMSLSHYVFRARAVQTQPLVRGNWSASVVHQIADVPAVSGLVAQTISLSGTGFAFVFADENAASPDYPASVVFTAELQNLTATVTFAGTAYNAAGAVVGSAGGITFTSVTATSATLTAANFNAAGATVRYVIVTASVASTNGTGTLTDKMTIYRGDAGSSAVQAMLTNEAHTLPTTSAGVVTYTGSGTTIRVFEGITELDYDGAGTAPGKWTASRAVTSGTLSTPGALSESGLTAVMANHAGMGTTAAQITVSITGKTLSGASFPTITKIQSLAKSWQGDAGAGVELWTVGATPQVITRTKTGTYTPNAITFQIYSQSGATAPALDSAYYSFYKGTGTTSYAWGTAITGFGSAYNGQSDLAASITTSTTALKFEAYSDSGRTVLLDTLVVPIVNEGSSALQGILSNQAHVFPASATGAVSSYVGSGTEIRVYEGAALLNFVTGTPGNGEWGLSTSQTNVTPGTVADSGAYATIGAHTGVADGTDTASIVYTLAGKTASGTAFSITQTQTFAKSKQGTTGASASRAYALYTGNPAPSGSAVVRSGTSLPLTNSWAFATAATSWTSTTQTPAAGQAMFQSDGVYDTAANQTTWNVPYLSNLKVGNLSAISADLGTVTAGSITGTANINITGTAQFEGANTVDGGEVAAVVANVSLDRKWGIRAYTSNVAGTALWGYNSATSGTGVYGTASGNAAVGVSGQATLGGIGVKANATGTGSIGVSGIGGAYGGVFSTGSVAAVQAGTTFAGLGLDCVGKATFSNQITSTLATGTAPFVVTSTTVVANLNVEKLNGTTWTAPGAIGGTTPAAASFTTLDTSGMATVSSLRINQSSASGTYAWNLPNGGVTTSGKPGTASTTGVFVPITINGVAGHFLWWPAA